MQNMEHCCERMAHAVKPHCERDIFDCVDNLVFYRPDGSGYGLIIHDGGSSSVEIYVCPWCGTKLPSSLDITIDISQFTFDNEALTVDPDHDLIIAVPRSIKRAKVLFKVFARNLQFSVDADINWEAIEEYLKVLPGIRQRRIVILHKDLPLRGNVRDLTRYLLLLSGAANTWGPENDHEVCVGFPVSARDAMSGALLHLSGVVSKSPHDVIAEFMSGQISEDWATEVLHATMIEKGLVAVEWLGMSAAENRAILIGASWSMLAAWREDGWPTTCVECGEWLDVGNLLSWLVKLSYDGPLGLKHLAHNMPESGAGSSDDLQAKKKRGEPILPDESPFWKELLPMKRGRAGKRG